MITVTINRGARNPLIIRGTERHCCIMAEKELRRCYDADQEAKVSVMDGNARQIDHVTGYLQDVMIELTHHIPAGDIQ